MSASIDILSTIDSLLDSLTELMYRFKGVGKIAKDISLALSHIRIGEDKSLDVNLKDLTNFLPRETDIVPSLKSFILFKNNHPSFFFNKSFKKFLI